MQPYRAIDPDWTFIHSYIQFSIRRLAALFYFLAQKGPIMSSSIKGREKLTVVWSPTGDIELAE